jgi:O-antigen/teichoic acid export membrane protein
MSTAKNLLMGVASTAWSALLGLILVPVYINYLGVKAYGLIGFFTTMQSMIQLLDAGLSSAVNREIARQSSSGTLMHAGGLLHAIAKVYWVTAVIIALVFAVLAPLIARFWLKSDAFSHDDLSKLIVFMGCTLAFRWPICLYEGALMGVQKLMASSNVNIIMVTIGNLGAIAVLYFVSPTIEMFFIWQAGIGLCHAACMRWAAWRAIGRQNRGSFHLCELKSVWRFSTGMSCVAISAFLLMQTDKLLLSKILTLEEFGGYIIAGMFANSLYLALTPTFNVIYPKLCKLVASDDLVGLKNIYRSGTFMLLSVLFPATAALAVFSEDILYIWTKNLTLAQTAAPVASMLLIGTALNGVMHFPYALQLAFGYTGLPLKINLLLLILMVPLTIILTAKFREIGGAISWLVLNATYLVIGIWLTHRRMLTDIALEWLSIDVGLPFSVSAIVIGVFGCAIRSLNLSCYLKVMAGCGLFISSVILVYAFSHHRKSTILSLLNNQ